jgi:hypothetical protein
MSPRLKVSPVKVINMNEAEEQNNGYDRHYADREIVATTFRDLLGVTGQVFSNALTEDAPSWTGETALPLYQHQRTLVASMIERETAFRQGHCVGNDTFFSRYAFLGDKEATGKSWTTVAYIQACKASGTAEQSYLNQLSDTNFYSIRRIQHHQQTNLIIVPNTHIHQWTELLEQAGNLNYLIVRRNNTIQSEDLVERIRNNDCVLVPNTLYNALCQRLAEENFQWTRCFIDDWTTCQLQRLQRCNNNLSSQFTWILSNDWFPFLFSDVRIDNWYMQAFIDNLGDAASKATRSFFERQKLYGSMPPPARSLFFDFICAHPQRGHLVVLCTDEFIQTSMAIAPPTNTIIPYCGDTLVRILVSLFSQKLGETLITENYIKALEMVGAQFTSTLEAATLQRPVDLAESCPICFDDLQVPTITNCCGAAFCARCLFQACQTSVSSRCPCCRGNLNGQRLTVIATRPVAPAAAHPCKLDTLIAALKARPNGRHLIYFPLEPMYGPLRAALKAADLNFDCLLGARQTVQKKMDRFNRGATDILILFNRHQILAARNLTSVSAIFFYPDNIVETDKIRLSGTKPLEIVGFRDMAGQ